LFLHIFSTRCASGETHEKEFPEDTNIMPPRGFMQPFGGFLDVVFIKYQKVGKEYE
jgi:hypothetical protein